MFSAISERFVTIIRRIRGKVSLTPAEVERELAHLRIALLEADVQLQVTRSFISEVRERINQESRSSLSTADQLTQIIYETLVSTLGGDTVPENAGAPPHSAPKSILLLGLQGSGKTTSAVKLGKLYRSKGFKPLLVCLDTKRPAASEQLSVMAKNAGLEVLCNNSRDSISLANTALQAGKAGRFLPVILDSAGRLHIDEMEVTELKLVKEAVQPCLAILVADASTGQDAVNIAKSFEEKIGIDGVMLTKVDSDARGGAILSMLKVTQKPILFVGTGERPEDIDPFEPREWAKRILGIADIETLMGTVRAEYSDPAMQEIEATLKEGHFTVQSFLEISKSTRKANNLTRMLSYLPGVRISAEQVEEGMRRLRRMEAIASSMTPLERRNPKLLNASRKRRIAKGSGTTVQEVNIFLKQFEDMKSAIKHLKKLPAKSGRRLF